MDRNVKFDKSQYEILPGVNPLEFLAEAQKAGFFWLAVIFISAGQGTTFVEGWKCKEGESDLESSMKFGFLKLFHMYKGILPPIEDHDKITSIYGFKVKGYEYQHSTLLALWKSPLGPRRGEYSYSEFQYLTKNGLHLENIVAFQSWLKTFLIRKTDACLWKHSHGDTFKSAQGRISFLPNGSVFAGKDWKFWEGRTLVALEIVITESYSYLSQGVVEDTKQVMKMRDFSYIQGRPWYNRSEGKVLEPLTVVGSTNTQWIQLPHCEGESVVWAEILRTMILERIMSYLLNPRIKGINTGDMIARLPESLSEHRESLIWTMEFMRTLYCLIGKCPSSSTSAHLELSRTSIDEALKQALGICSDLNKISAEKLRIRMFGDDILANLLRDSGALEWSNGEHLLDKFVIDKDQFHRSLNAELQQT